MYRLTLIIFFLFTYFSSNAQLNYKKVDSISYALYQQKKWTELQAFAQNPSVKEYNYYLFNLRIGIANYTLKDYEMANVYFIKALKNNSSSQTVLEYLFWTNLMLKKEKTASQYYQKLDKEIQDRIQYQPKKLFDFIYFEGGKNIQEVKNSKEGDINYYNIGFNHYLTDKITLYHSYYYQQQDLEFSNYTIHRYYINPTFLLKNNFSAGLILNYALLNNNINYLETTNYSSTEQDVDINGVLYDKVTNGTETNTYKGTQNEREFVTGIFISKTIKNFRIASSFSFSQKTTKTNAIEKTTGTENIVYLLQGNEVSNDDFPFESENIINKDSVSTKYNFELTLGYRYKKIDFSLSSNIVSVSNNVDINYIPSIIYKVSDKVSLTGTFIQKGKNEYYYYNGLYFIHNANPTKRYSLVSDIQITKNINFYLIYQKDIITTNLNINNRSNTYIGGLKFKL